MRLDSETFRYLTPIDWRTLISIEMGMRNHEFVPRALIPRIANSRGGGIEASLAILLRYKLIVHNGQSYDGYKLTYLGYDFLALRTFVARKQLRGIGRRIGVGKESDIHVGENVDGESVIMKVHRLGRISFRTIKKNRDYLKNRRAKNWLYFARLAAGKEYAYLTALHQAGFPVPRPLDLNRHSILMEYIDGFPLYQVTDLKNPHKVLEDLMALVVRLAYAGLVHCDYNEFNIMVNKYEQIFLIDFPQMVSVTHYNAESLFAHDVECICKFFNSKFGIQVHKFPKFSELGIKNSPIPLRGLPVDSFNEKHPETYDEFDQIEEVSDKKQTDPKSTSQNSGSEDSTGDVPILQHFSAEADSSLEADSNTETNSSAEADLNAEVYLVNAQISTAQNNEEGGNFITIVANPKKKRPTKGSRVPRKDALGRRYWKKNHQKAKREAFYTIQDFQD